MIKNSSALLFACLLIFVAATESAGQTSAKPQPAADNAKMQVAKLGTGEKARAEIKMRSGERVRGYISSAEENDFTVTDKRTGQSTFWPTRMSIRFSSRDFPTGRRS